LKRKEWMNRGVKKRRMKGRGKEKVHLEWERREKKEERRGRRGKERNKAMEEINETKIWFYFSRRNMDRREGKRKRREKREGGKKDGERGRETERK
jgi:hypothetical protein